MKGDFSRFTFDARKHYSRVLMQQGRVQLDADWNEQVAMLLERLETLGTDLIGPFGGPAHACGFIISPSGKTNDFNIGKGRYYVDGVPCENDDDNATYLSQPFEPAKKTLDGGGLIYLDTWEEYVNAADDEEIRERGSEALIPPDAQKSSGRCSHFRSQILFLTTRVTPNRHPSAKTGRNLSITSSRRIAVA